VQDQGDHNLTNVTVTVTSGTNVVQVVSDANGNWTASVPPGSVSVVVDTNDVDFLAQVAAVFTQTEGTVTSTVTAVAGKTASVGNDGYFKPGPTAVTMVWLGAYVDRGQVWVTWQTCSESGLLGFDVGRSAAGAAEQLVTLEPVLADGRSLGYRYTLADSSARLPGEYTYRLVGYRDDGSTAELARVKVSLAAGASAGVVRMEGIEATSEGVRVRWLGGQPPYVLESSPSAGPDAVWHVVGPAQAGETEALVPQEDQTGFFRVRFGQQ
jgi:hypothetical protein